MTRTSLIAAAVLALAASPAWAVYKCKDATGRTVFQERACEATGAKGGQIDVTPAAGNVAPPAAAVAAPVVQPSAPGAQPQTEAQRLRAKSDREGKERRLSELREREIPSAEGRIRTATNQCSKRMGSTQGMKAYANNNLAGATWEQSLSTEMQAIATQCGAEQTRLNAALDRLHSEKSRLEQELSR